MKKNKVGYYIVGILISFLFLLPLLWGFMLSFKDSRLIFSDPFSLPTSFDFSMYWDTFKSANMGTLFLNSIALTTVTTVLSLLFVFLSSYSIARLTLKGRKMNDFFYYLFLAATSIPVFAILLTTFGLVNKIGTIVPVLGIDKLFGLMLPYVARQVPFLTLLFVGGLKSMPAALEEAAIIDGCNLSGVIFRITLPTVKPIFATGFILTFLSIWNEYPIASILLSTKSTYTIPMAMSFFKSEFATDYAAMLRAIVIILIPQLVFYMIFQKNIVDGMATAGVK